MKIFLIAFFSLLSLSGFCQKKKTYFPAWTFHQGNSTINGLSVGLWDFASRNRNTTSNGIRLALIGEGILAPLAPSAPSYVDDSVVLTINDKDFGEKINGINLAGSGNLGDYIINGISLGLIGQLNSRVNGISAAVMVNYAGFHNGIQLGMFNDAYKMTGFQIGIANKTKHTKGIQVGIWNVNERRKFPIFNWNL